MLFHGDAVFCDLPKGRHSYMHLARTAQPGQPLGTGASLWFLEAGLGQELKQSSTPKPTARRGAVL